MLARVLYKSQKRIKLGKIMISFILNERNVVLKSHKMYHNGEILDSFLIWKRTRI